MFTPPFSGPQGPIPPVSGENRRGRPIRGFETIRRSLSGGVSATPTVLFGPGDIRQAHATDESVSVEELEVTAETLALTALRFYGYEDDRPI